MTEIHQHIATCGIIILAGGKSSRLGTAKQLLPYGSSTLLEHAVQTAIGSGIGPVIVVLGAEKERIGSSIKSYDVQVAENDEWEEGMASSIRCGIKKLLQYFPGTDGAMIMVCDQPFVNKELLQEMLILQQQTGKPAVSASYAGISGTPVLFHKDLFNSLLALKGDRGARKFLAEHPEMAATIEFPEGKLDIDTETDYKNLQQWEKNPAT